jgi:hypothetical protein
MGGLGGALLGRQGRVHHRPPEAMYRSLPLPASAYLLALLVLQVLSPKLATVDLKTT